MKQYEGRHYMVSCEAKQFTILLHRSVMVVDNAVAKDSSTSRLKVQDGNDLQVGAPMKGEVVEIKVAKGDVVEKGQGMINIS